MSRPGEIYFSAGTASFMVKLASLRKGTRNLSGIIKAETFGHWDCRRCSQYTGKRTHIQKGQPVLRHWSSNLRALLSRVRVGTFVSSIVCPRLRLPRFGYLEEMEKQSFPVLLRPRLGTVSRRFLHRTVYG